MFPQKHSGLRRIGFGAAPLGGFPNPIDRDVAIEAVETAWASGVRYFDTAPFYGYGQSERLLGEVLRTKPRDEYIISTKIGRLLISGTVPEEEGIFKGTTTGLRPVWDFSAEGVARSLEGSLQRMGLDRVDVALIHDPNNHMRQAVEEAFPALAALRSAGVIGAIGAGMNYAEPLCELVRKTDLDCVLAAGCCTLIDRSAFHALLPLAQQSRVDVVVGGVLHQGLLVDHPGANTHGLWTDVRIQKARQLREACQRSDVPLAAAALQFPLRFEQVVSVLIGTRSASEFRLNMTCLETPIKPDLWSELDEIASEESRGM